MPSDPDFKAFTKSLAYAGLGYSEKEQLSLYVVAKKCARTRGIPLGAATGVATATVGAVTIPGVGSVPGWVAGFLAGFLSGTVMCTIAEYPLKNELDKMLRPDE